MMSSRPATTAEVCPYSEQLLRAAFRNAEAGLDLVDDQQDVVSIAQLADMLHVFASRRDAAAVAHDRLDQESADVLVMLAEQVLDRIGVIEWRCVVQLFRDPGYAFAKGQYLGIAITRVPVLDFRVPHDLTENPVIAAFEDDVAILAGERACDPERRHHGFGARVRKADQFSRGHHVADAAGHLVFEFGRQGEYAAHLHAGARGLIDARVRVTEDDRAVGQPVVDVFVVVEVPYPRTPALADIDGLVFTPVAKIR
jgi:hypothetical protein